MKWNEILKLKKLLDKFLITKDKTFKDKILFEYLEYGTSANILTMINNFMVNYPIKMIEVLEFQAYMLGYNLKYERLVTPQEKLAVNISLLVLDDDGNVISDEEDIIVYFEKYKEKFIGEGGYRNA